MLFPPELLTAIAIGHTIGFVTLAVASLGGQIYLARLSGRLSARMTQLELRIKGAEDDILRQLAPRTHVVPDNRDP